MAWMALVAAGVSAYAGKKKADAAASIGMGQGMSNAPDLRTNEAVFDNSGWNVSFGSSHIDSTATKTTELSGATAPGAGLTAGPAGLAGGLLPNVAASAGITQNQLIYGAAALGLVLVWKRRKT